MEKPNSYLAQFASQRQNPIFIDKTLILDVLNQRIDWAKKFLCLTMPSRFGKTYLAQMIAAYYTNDGDSRSLFADLAIANKPSYRKHINKHNLIKLDIAGICANKPDSEMVAIISQRIKNRIQSLLPNLEIKENEYPDEVFEHAYQKYGATFVFVIDEWDYILRNHKDKPRLFDEYIGLLRSLFKNSDLAPVFDLVYMTGIMPIKRYEGMSALNVFDEATMVRPNEFSPFFGFSENEVKQVIEQSKTTLSIEDLRHWYDGYRFKNAFEVYSPNSVIKACVSNECQAYFMDTIATNDIKNGLKNNRIDLEADATVLLSGGSVSVEPGEFDADLANLNSRDKGLSALVHSGFLSFDSDAKTAKIPNKEVGILFASAVKGLSWPALNDPILESADLLKRTLSCDEAYVKEAFDRFHQELASIFGKNREDVLSVIAYILYYAAKADYYTFKEPNTGLGRADILFVPVRPNQPGIVLELKVDTIAKSALDQIESLHYYKEFENHVKEVVLVAISYQSKSLKHSVSIRKKTL